MVHNVAGADGESGVGRHVGDGGVHAVREAHGRVAVVVAVGAGRRVADAGLVVLGVGPCPVNISILRSPVSRGCCPLWVGKGATHLQQMGFVQFADDPGTYM